MSPEERIAAIQARRAARAADHDRARQAQLADDLEALDAAETKHGIGNVKALDVEYAEGFPTMLIVHVPEPVRMKVFRDRVKQKNADNAKATIEIGAECIAYPSAEVFKAWLEVRPGLDVQAGLAALKLASAKVKDEGEG